MKYSKQLLLALACTWTLGAWGQWQWVDKDGRKVFSNQAPPVDIPEKNILKRPRGAADLESEMSGGMPKPDGMPADVPPPTAPALPPVSGKDKRLEEEKAKAKALEDAKKQAEEKRIAKNRAENCDRAKRAKTALTSGQRMNHINAKGETVEMDEATRKAELRRVNEVIASDCRRR